MSETLDTIEETLDVIEDTLDQIESFESRPRNALVAGVAVVSILAGAAVGYFIAKKRYRAIADAEVAEVKARYRLLAKDGEYADVNALAEKYETSDDEGKAVADDILKREGYTPYNNVSSIPAEEKPVEAVQKSIFRDAISRESDDPESYWDWSEEQQRRIDEPNKPYVITQNEFNENVDDYNTITLTYYDGDQVLVDDGDQPITDEESVVGASNLLRFGHASGDQNVVYVCNNRLGSLFEVVRTDGKYAEIVLGFIEHSDNPGVRKFRSRRD